jgi:lipid-binding SYLF domain-containing protein
MIGSMRRILIALGLVLGMVGASGAHADSTGQQRVVERARLALDAFLDDPNFADMRAYVQNAYGVLIVPEMLKAGFFFGAEYGIGVFLVRDQTTGHWGQPAFYDLYGGSFGLQFGGQSSDVVFTIMNEGAVDKILTSDVKVQFGADAGMAVGRIGAGVGAGTTTHFGEDIYVFAKSKGLYGGVSVDGTFVVPNADWNQAYYGHPVSPEEIVRSRQVMASNGVDALHQTLTRF